MISRRDRNSKGQKSGKTHRANRLIVFVLIKWVSRLNTVRFLSDSRQSFIAEESYWRPIFIKPKDVFLRKVSSRLFFVLEDDGFEDGKKKRDRKPISHKM